ncbi:MAG TPA: hypothetical protein VJ385_21570 [Fibrobacteria bacterium]|nr:hypothetical protein [Fibrobacteria bacterium]
MDTASYQRIIKLTNPKIAVLWRAVGNRDTQIPSGQKSVDLSIPFAFTIDLLKAPPKKMLEADQIAFGIFYVFSDANRNGTFDRLVHPDILRAYADLDTLAAYAKDALTRFYGVSASAPKTPISEIFYLESSGALLKVDGDGLDTVMAAGSFRFVEGPGDYLRAYQRILGGQNRWEIFFAKRKKQNEFYIRTFPVMGHFLGYEIRFDRTYFPKPGRAAEFTEALKRVTAANFTQEKAANEISRKAFESGKMDYPFSGFGVPGEDWLAGRSITDLLLFLPTAATLDTLLRAIPTGSFCISHIERFQQGYNLVHCDDQYVCDVRSPNDSILVYLGTSEAYFNAPSSRSQNPIPKPTQVKAPIEAAALSRMEGRYALNGSDTVSIAVRNGEIWCDATGLGLLRVVPSDSFGVYSPKFDFQALYTPGFPMGVTDRLVQYSQGDRNVVLRLGGKVREDFLERVDRASGFARIDLPDSVVNGCVGKYDYGGDTLRVSLAGGDSLSASIPGFSQMVFHAAGEAIFKSPWGEWSLEFQGFNGQAYSRLVFWNGGSKKVVPLFNPFPSKSLKTTQFEETGIDWISGNPGTGRDAFVDLNGRKRYACSQDGAFLRPGDGYLMGFSRTSTSDSISLRQGGDFATFRFPGMEGKTAILELRNCAERSGKTKRMRISVWGGSGPGSMQMLYGDHQWMVSDTSGVYWVVDSLAIGSDPYYLILKQEDTPDTPFQNSFDGYRLGIRP